MTTFFHARHVATLLLTLLAALGGAAACKNQGSAGGSDAAPTKDGGAAAAAAPSGLPAPPDVAEPPADATKTASGLAFKILTPGTGTEHPSQNDSVKVNYSGWTTDGKMFDSSVAPLQPGRKGEPMTLSLARVIPGWTEGMQLMVVGEKRRFWIPEDLAYKGKPGAPAGMLVFDIELLDFTPGPKPPADVAAAPADAEKTKDGLASKVTQKGTGTAHPQANDTVRVNFSILAARRQAPRRVEGQAGVASSHRRRPRAGPRACSRWSSARSAPSGCRQPSGSRDAPGSLRAT